MITKRDIAIIIEPVLATYIAKELGTVDVSKLLCPQDTTLDSGFLTVVFKKGNLIFDRFNILMRQYLEAGFLERPWAELQHRASLSKQDSLGEEFEGIYFAFSFSHLLPAFVVLLLGTLFSSVVFIAELILNCLYKRRGILWL